MKSPNTLTVIVRDDSPMRFANDCPSYRTVVLQLTEEQQKQIVYSSEYEYISRAILEVKP